MNAPALLFTALSLLNGRPTIGGQPMNCEPMKSCFGTTFTPAAAGICVHNGTAQRIECWNACDQEIPLDAYAGVDVNGAPQTASTVQAMAMLVQQARTQQDICPGFEWDYKECDLGQRCTVVTLKRGMCTLEVNSTGYYTNRHVCIDMCDMSVPLSAFGMNVAGGQADVEQTVALVRAGRDPMGQTVCPATSVWLWLWFPIVLCCILGCCFGGFQAFQYWKRVNKNRNKLNNMDNEFGQYSGDQYDPYMQQQDYQDFPDQGPPADYMQVPASDVEMQQQPEVPVASRDMQAPIDDPMPVAPDPMPVAPPQEPPQAPQQGQMTQPMTQLPPQQSSVFAPTTYAGPAGVTTMAAPSTFYNSHQLATSYPAGMGGSMYSQGGATYQMPGTMVPQAAAPGMPVSASYRIR